MPAVRAVYRRVLGSASVTSRLALWEFESGVTLPAVFTVDPAPAECGNPVVVITLEGSEPFNDRRRRGRVDEVSVRVWGDRTGSGASLRGLGIGLWTLLDRCDLELEGMTFSGCRAVGPRRLVDDEGYPGYEVRCFVKGLEE